jgi:hypothetical protein
MVCFFVLSPLHGTKTLIECRYEPIHHFVSPVFGVVRAGRLKRNRLPGCLLGDFANVENKYTQIYYYIRVDFS